MAVSGILTTASRSALPQRDLILVLAAATIVISLVVQGFTPEPLARLAGFGPAVAGPTTKRPSPGCARPPLTLTWARNNLVAANPGRGVRWGWPVGWSGQTRRPGPNGR